MHALCMRGSREGGQGVRNPAPRKSQNIGFLSSTGPDSLKSQNYQASIQCWVIIGTPSKRTAFRRRVNDSPLMNSGIWILPPLIKLKKK